MNVEVKDIQKSFVFKPRLLFLVLMYVNARMVESVKSFPGLEANVYVTILIICKSREIVKKLKFFLNISILYTIWTMFQYLLKMILPTYDDKISYELPIDNSNSKISDEMWIKLFHTKLADLNRRVDEANKNITNPKTPPQKHSRK